MDLADVDQEALVGRSSEEVPTVAPGEKCNGKRTTGSDPVEFQGYCKNVAGKGTDHLHEGRCQNHGGSNIPAPEGNDYAVDNDGGAPLGNDNRVDHGAFAANFRDSMTEGEVEAFNELSESLQDPGSAQQVGITLASEYLIKYQRTGDVRFGRRFESVCETFGVAPEDMQEHLHTHDHRHRHDHDQELSDRELSAIDHVTGGPDEIQVEAVENADDDGDDEPQPEIGW